MMNPKKNSLKFFMMKKKLNKLLMLPKSQWDKI
jgi:hypothetical protein